MKLTEGSDDAIEKAELQKAPWMSVYVPCI